jgi:hypothetical protein
MSVELIQSMFLKLPSAIGNGFLQKKYGAIKHPTGYFQIERHFPQIFADFSADGRRFFSPLTALSTAGIRRKRKCPVAGL